MQRNNKKSCIKERQKRSSKKLETLEKGIEENKEKAKKYCTHCKRTGYELEEYFKKLKNQ